MGTNAGHPGRPRNVETDDAILRATLDLISEVGVGGVTLTAAAARAGVARATVYLRWPSRAALVGAAAKAVVGGRPFPLSGDLEVDVRSGAEFMQRLFGAPYLAGILPELMRATLATPPEITFDDLAPNREALASEYVERAAAQGFDPTVDPHLPFDLLFGFALSYVFATSKSPSVEYARQMADAVVRGLRRPPGP